MVLKKTIDTVGGVISILSGVFSLLMAYWDWSVEHSVWRVWAILGVIFFINGIAMLIVAGRARMIDKGIANRPSSRVL